MTAWRTAALLGLTIPVLACCGEETHGPAVSPDGRYEAAVIERTCGATTDYVTLLRMTDRQAWIVKSQDVMQVNTSWPLVVSWSGPRALTIEYPARRRPPAEKTYGPPDRWEEVAITLKEADGGPAVDLPVSRTP